MNSDSIAQIVGGWSTFATFLVALVSAVLIFWQVYAARRLAQRTFALETHREYLKICIDRPELGCSSTMLKRLGRASFAGIMDELQPETEECLWFLSYVLHTMEQVLEATRTWGRVDAKWKAVTYSQLKYHDILLSETWPAWRDHYGEELQSIVDKIAGAPGSHAS